MKSEQRKTIKQPLRVTDFLCGRCNVQPTGSLDHVCGICKALGQRVEPMTVSWREYILAAKLTKMIIYWLENCHLLKPKDLKKSLPQPS